jgi:xanthine dehydrogenase accessory factor
MIRELEQMISLVRRGETFAVATVLRAAGSPGRIGHKMVVRGDGTTFGTIGGGSLEEAVKADARTALASKEGAVRTYVLSRNAKDGLDSLCGGKLDVVIEIVPGKPNLLLAGGGHVARAVGELCRQLDYPYSVIDDREEATAAELWPGAVEVIRSHPGEYLANADLASFSHLLILNYSHRLDYASLEAALQHFPGIIGMIGSDRKRKQIYAQLSPELRAQTDRVRCPVGVPLPAVSPAEIAVSIMAQVIGDRDPRYRESTPDAAEEPGAREEPAAERDPVAKRKPATKRRPGAGGNRVAKPKPVTKR